MYGEKDQDGFYYGELRGVRGYVPHNMVSELDEHGAVVERPAGPPAMPGQPGGVPGGVSGALARSGLTSVRGVSRDRWGGIYANEPVKRMVALYDYDPHELSPNVDAEVSGRNWRCDGEVETFCQTRFTARSKTHVKTMKKSRNLPYLMSHKASTDPS